MNNDYQTAVDDLAVSLTKPATKLGVPFAPFYISIMLCFLGWMLYQLITGSTNMVGVMIIFFIWLICYGVMFYLTSRDIFGLDIFWMNFTQFQQHRSHGFWGNTDSYAS